MSAQVGYLRVSSLLQNTARQLDGVLLDQVFEEKASGKDTHRPQWKAYLAYLRAGDTLDVHAMDRLARNLDDLRGIVKELTDQGFTEPLDRYLRERVMQDIRRRVAACFVVLADGSRIAGYYTLPQPV